MTDNPGSTLILLPDFLPRTGSGGGDDGTGARSSDGAAAAGDEESKGDNADNVKAAIASAGDAGSGGAGDDGATDIGDAEAKGDEGSGPSTGAGAGAPAHEAGDRSPSNRPEQGAGSAAGSVVGDGASPKSSAPHEALPVPGVGGWWCRKVQVLNVAENHLQRLPNALCDLRQLRMLWANGNLISSLPEDFGVLQMLTHLDLSDNKLAVLPE